MNKESSQAKEVTHRKEVVREEVVREKDYFVAKVQANNYRLRVERHEAP